MGVSVVIPAYNAAATIERCIISCYEQSLTPKEIIIVDDQSQDETWITIHNLAQTYTSIPIVAVKNETNVGVAATRNKGIQIAKFDYIALLDSDDMWHYQKLEICLEVLQQYPNIPILFHNYDSNIVVDVNLVHSHFKHHQETIQEVISSNKLQGSVIVFKNNANIHFDPSFRYAEDLEFGIRYVLTSKIIHLQAALTKTNRLQLSAGGLSANKWRMRKGEIKAFLTLPKYHWKYYMYVPSLITFSLLKHIRRLLFKSKK